MQVRCQVMTGSILETRLRVRRVKLSLKCVFFRRRYGMNDHRSRRQSEEMASYM
jgi:hypothetical protein